MRMLLADDQELVRETIAAFLRLAPDIAVDVAHDPPRVLEMVRTSPRYDLVMLDYMMRGMNRLGGLQVMRQAAPGGPVAILSGAAPQVLAEQALAAGLAGFVPKTILTRSMLAAVRFIAAGEIYALFTPQTGAETAAAPGAAALTARDLSLQEVTVKLHVKTLYRKIGARNRTHAVLIAREMGLE